MRKKRKRVIWLRQRQFAVKTVPILDIIEFFWMNRDFNSYEFSVEKPEDTENVWEAYLEISGDTPWFNNQAYVNTLDKKAIRKFLDITHEQYYKRLGEDFGSEIKSIFTDEPQTTHKGMPG